ncbi:MAG: NAD(+)/NADH kinase [Clostridia bacterium]|nr:NAD(+)/NADH kinase [Clostridia bacterium]
MKKILILTNPVKDPDGEVSSAVKGYLEGADREIIFESDPVRAAGIGGDLAVVLGGDGSIMRAAGAFAPAGIPILGVNLGKVGYMTELEVNELGLLGKFFTGEYEVEHRMMLSVTFDGDTLYALNDAVISNGAISKMAALSLFCGEMHVNDYRADGLIISTPTGSTAYSMSAGGPIIDPQVECLLATPVCSHSLSSRPIVFSGGSRLTVKNISRDMVQVYLTLDGAKNFLVNDGDSVVIERAPIVTKLVRIKYDGFYSRLGKKVN